MIMSILSIALLVLLPILGIGALYVMIKVANWLYILVSVVMGDREIIHDFDCKNRPLITIADVVSDFREDFRQFRDNDHSNIPWK